MSMSSTLRRGALLSLGLVLLTGCSTPYYKTMEMFGYEKRDILTSRVEDGRDEQQEAKEQFVSALEAFKSVANFDGGDLEKVYKQLQSELSACEARAADVADRIESIESVAEDLFAEWEAEIETFSDPRLKGDSRVKLAETRGRYEPLIASMRKAEGKMHPVLKTFRDQVLYLKHSLNAAAIASLQDQVFSIETDVAALVADMEASIAEADAFIATLG